MTKKGKRTSVSQRDARISGLEIENAQLKARLARYEKGADTHPDKGEDPRPPADKSRLLLALDESERSYRLLAENATDVIWTVDTDLNITYISPSVTRVLGYRPEELMGKPFQEIFPRESLETIARLQAEDRAAESRQTGSISGRTLDIELLPRDGLPIWVEAVTAPIRDQAGRVSGFQGACREVTERRKAQAALAASEERFRTMFQKSPIGVVIYDSHGAPQEVNQACMDIFGLSRDAALKGPSLLNYPNLPEGEKKRLRAGGTMVFETLVDLEAARQAGLYSPARQGTVFVRLVAAPLGQAEDGSPGGYLSLVEDITGRKQMEEALRVSEERLRQVTENMLDAVSLLDKDGVVRYASPSHERIVGYKPEEMVGKPALDLIHPDDIETLVASLQGMGESGVSGVQYRFRHRDGHYVRGEACAKPLLDSAGNVTGYVIASRDVTERREAEEALQRQERFFRAVTENSTDGILVAGRDGKVKYESPGALRLLGLSRDRTGLSVMAPIHPDDLPAAAEVLSRVLSGQPARVEMRARHVDGSWRTIDANLVNLLDDPAVEGIVVNMRDITESKKAREALLASEEKNRLLVENANEAIAVVQDGVVKFGNPKLMELGGYTMEELASRPFIEMVHPDDRQQVAEYHLRRMRGEEVPSAYELRTITKSGDVRWSELKGTMFEWEGRPAAMALMHDVTGRKLAEERLRHEEQLFRMLTECSQDLVVLVNTDGTIRYESPAGEHLLGFKPEERMGASVFERVHPDDAALVMAAFARLRDHPEAPPERNEIHLRHKDGSWRTLDAVASVIARDGGVEGVMINVRDVTDRKRAEEALREAKEYAENLIRTANVLVVQVDIEGRATLLNEAGEKITGYTQAEVLGKRWFDLLVPEDRYPHIWEAFRAFKAGGPLQETYESPLITKSGEERIISLKNNLLIQNGQVAGVLSFGMDVTEHRRAEENLRQAHAELEARVEQRTAELRESNEQLVEEAGQRQQAQDRLEESEARYRGLVESANSIIMELDTRGRVTFFNRFAQEFYGYKDSEIIGRQVVGTITPEVDSAGNDLRVSTRDLVTHPEQHVATEGEGMLRNGDRVWISWTTKGLYDTAGRLRNVLCIGMDRTEQRRTAEIMAQQALERAAVEERQRLARDLHDAVTQMLFSASIIAGVLPRLWERDQAEGQRRLDELRQLTRGALAEMRLLLLELRPAALEEVGLADLLRHLAEASAGRGGFPVSFSAEGQCAMPADAQIALYRVAQEALANAVNHSQASQAKVQLVCARQSATLTVTDDGCGFDVKKVSPEHLGLRIMQERAEAVGATLTVISSKKHGTEVRALWTKSGRKERP